MLNCPETMHDDDEKDHAKIGSCGVPWSRWEVLINYRVLELSLEEGVHASHFYYKAIQKSDDARGF